MANLCNRLIFVSSPYSASFIVDGVILSERGMTCLKQQTVEREKTRRRKRVGIGGEGYDPMNPNAPPGDGSDNDDDGPEDDIMPPPTLGPSGPASLGMMGKGKDVYHTIKGH